MAAVVDLDLNRRPPSPEPAIPEELRGVMLRHEQPFPDQMDLPKLYWAPTNLPDGSFWKQSSDTLSNLRSTHEHIMNNFDEKGNPDVHSNSNKLKRQSDADERNINVKSSIRRKPDVGVWEKCSYHNVIDLEKLATSDDEVEIVSSSGFGFGNLANGNGRSQDGSCCVSPENCSLAESGQLCRERNASRVSPGSVGSSDTPDCQSPSKPNNTESRHSLIDLNVPLEESLHVSYAPSQEICSPLIFSSSSHHEDFCSSSSKVFQKEYGSNVELKESSIRVIAPSSAADSSRKVHAACSVQGKGLIDLNVSIGSIGMPSTITSNFTDKVLNNDESEGTVSYHSFSKNNSPQAETVREHPIVEYNHMLASQDDTNMLLPISTNDEISEVQSPDSETVNYKLLIPETPQVDNYVCPSLGASHDGASNPQETVGMLQAETEEGDKMACIAAETLLSIFSDNSACAADCPGRNSETAAQGGNDELQRSLDSYEEIILNVEEIRDDGESTPVIPPDKDGDKDSLDSCGIKLRRGRGLRNFQREIMPGLVSLSRHEICDDLHAIGYELRKTRSRKTCRDKGSPSTRGRPPKRSSTARN